MRKFLGVLLACVLFSGPVVAQSQADKEREAAAGQRLFYIGLGVGVMGLTPLFMGTSKGAAIGLPIVAGGGALAYYGHQKRKKAERTSVAIVPLKKGVAVGVVRTW